MSTNQYFQNGQGPGQKSEQDVTESIIIEMIQMAGTDFYFIPRTLVNVDNLFNEDPMSKFDGFAKIEMYPINYQDFGGQGHLLGKFGLDVADTLELVVSKRRAFEETNFDILNDGAGSLLYWPLQKAFWQINFIDDEMSPFYQLSNLYTFTLKCTRYIYNYEPFSTGVKDIDDLNQYTTPFAGNNVINDEGNANLDFSENNPFGNPGESDSNG